MEITMTFTYKVEDLVDGATDEDVRKAAEALRDIMDVQSEDGLYSLGSPDEYLDGVDSEFVANLRIVSTDVKLV